MKVKLKRQNKKRWREVFLIVGVVLFITVCRLLIVEIVRIPSDSMSKSLLTGDFVLMNKLQYGTRIFTHDHVKRTFAFSEIKRFDIFIFNNPIKDTILSKFPYENYYKIAQLNKKEDVANINTYGQILFQDITQRRQTVKRCVGIPGDTILINKNILFVNGEPVLEKETITQPELILITMGHVLKEQRKRKPEERDYATTYPNDFVYPWSESIYGPIYVPKKNDVIKLDLINISLYKRVIEAYEKNNVQINDSSILINGQSTWNYTFKQNYYFAMGDNRGESLDSRHWGFIPEDHIKGKVTRVLVSMSDSTLRWNRIFKKIG